MAIRKDITVTVENQKSIMSDSVYIYQGDKDIDLYFTIVDDRFEFESTTVKKYNFTIRKPDGDLLPETSIVPMQDNKAKLTITEEMANEFSEVGKYDILIHLYDEKNARITIPEISFEVKKPLMTTNVMTNSGLVSNAILDDINEKLTRLNSDGRYNRTVWEKGDLITKEKLNKIEYELEDLNNSQVDVSSQLADIVKKQNGLQVYIEDYLNPEMTIDYIVAFENAIADLKLNGGGTLLLKQNKSYGISRGIEPCSNIVIDLNGATIKTLGTEIFSNSATILIKNVSDVTIKNGTVIGNKDLITIQYEVFHTIDIKNSSNVTIDNMNCSMPKGDCVDIDGGTNVTIKNCTLKMNHRNFISVVSGTNVDIYNNFMETTEQIYQHCGVDIEPYSPTMKANNINVHDNIMIGCRHGVVVLVHELNQGIADDINIYNNIIKSDGRAETIVVSNATNIRIKNNDLSFLFYPNVVKAVQFRGTNKNINIDSNTFTLNGLSFLIYITDIAENINIINNVVNGHRTGGESAFIQLMNTPTSHINNVIVKGNIINDMEYFIYLNCNDNANIPYFFTKENIVKNANLIYVVLSKTVISGIVTFSNDMFINCSATVNSGLQLIEAIKQGCNVLNISTDLNSNIITTFGEYASSLPTASAQYKGMVVFNDNKLKICTLVVDKYEWKEIQFVQ